MFFHEQGKMIYINKKFRFLAQGVQREAE